MEERKKCQRLYGKRKDRWREIMMVVRIWFERKRERDREERDRQKERG